MIKTLCKVLVFCDMGQKYLKICDLVSVNLFKVMNIREI